jgi:hypothetical protein
MIPLLLLSQAFANPALRASGTCPGPLTFEVTGATPGGQVRAFRSNSAGATVVPAGPCAGTPLGLANGPVPNHLQMHGTFTADSFGDWEFAFNALPGACAARLQFVDLTTCQVSNVVHVDPPSPCAPGALIADVPVGGGIGSPDAITDTPSGLLVNVLDPAAGNLLTYIDPFTLAVTQTFAAGLKVGLPALNYDPVGGSVWHNTTTSALGEVVRYPVLGNAWIVKERSFVDAAASAVHPATGLLHLPDRAAGGVSVWDPSVNFVQTWAPGLHAQDLEFTPTGDYAYAIDNLTQEIVRYDLRPTVPTEIDRWSTTFAGQGLLAWDIGLSPNQEVLAVDPALGRVVVWDRFGRELGSVALPPGATPWSVYDLPADPHFLVAYDNAGVGGLRRVCSP